MDHPKDHSLFGLGLPGQAFVAHWVVHQFGKVGGKRCEKILEDSGTGMFLEQSIFD